MHLSSFIVKRLLQAVFVIVVVSLLVAFAIRLSGDPTAIMLRENASASAEDIAAIRAALGVDKPFLQQYFGFISGLLHGELGNSFFRGPISPLISRAIGASLLLAFSALAVSLSLSLPLGIYAARHKGKKADQVIRLLSLAGLSFPNFWLGMMFVLLFAVKLKWLPPSGFYTWQSLIMPALTIGIILTASNVRIVRSAMLEVLHQQYVMVARAKGLSERTVIWQHALRNAAITIITYIGLQFGALMGGLVVVEMVFNWPGLGTLAIEAIAQRDYPILQTVVTLLAVIIVLVNLLIDIAYMLLDPRIREK